jgi:hypothetical protein
MSRRIAYIVVAFFMVMALVVAAAGGTTYYVDSAGGDDGNAGTSMSAAWKTPAMAASKGWFLRTIRRMFTFRTHIPAHRRRFRRPIPHYG